MKLGPITSVRDIRHAHMFCGVGVGAKGMNRASPRVGNVQARFVCVGGIDNDAGAIRNFDRLTGARGTVRCLFSRQQYVRFHGREPGPAWREAGPADIRKAYGPITPDVLFLSAPCKGFSGLLSATQSKTDKYQALNELTVRGVWLALEAYKDDPIPVILFENVPRILTRGRWLLDQIIALLRQYGYSVNLDTHDCGIIGGLAQSRKRALLVARHMEKLPPFIYQPRHHRMKGVGEVIGKLPLPGDPVAGPMHRVPSLQWKTWVRLALVPAGKDWRALNELAVVDGNLRDFGIIPEQALRDNALGVNHWSDIAPVITTHRAPGQGRFSVADPRPTWGNQRHQNILRVTPYDQATGTISGGGHSVTGGQPCVADARREHFQTGGHYGVVGWDQTGYAVSGSACHDNGFNSVADPRDAIFCENPILLPKPDDRLVCRIIATDGTWHRPFTTLDLASLQSLFEPEEVFYQEEGIWKAFTDFDLIGGSDVTKREWIGNAVPGAAATGMAETIGETILLADAGESFFLSSREIWAKPGALALSIDNDQAAFRMDGGR
jgi:site-specific DNA-cytosine methylase